MVLLVAEGEGLEDEPLLECFVFFFFFCTTAVDVAFSFGSSVTSLDGSTSMGVTALVDGGVPVVDRVVLFFLFEELLLSSSSTFFGFSIFSLTGVLRFGVVFAVFALEGVDVSSSGGEDFETVDFWGVFFVPVSSAGGESSKVEGSEAEEAGRRRRGDERGEVTDVESKGAAVPAAPTPEEDRVRRRLGV